MHDGRSPLDTIGDFMEEGFALFPPQYSELLKEKPRLVPRAPNQCVSPASIGHAGRNQRGSVATVNRRSPKLEGERVPPRHQKPLPQGSIEPPHSHNSAQPKLSFWVIVYLLTSCPPH